MNKAQHGATQRVFFSEFDHIVAEIDPKNHLIDDLKVSLINLSDTGLGAHALDTETGKLKAGHSVYVKAIRVAQTKPGKRTPCLKATGGKYKGIPARVQWITKASSPGVVVIGLEFEDISENMRAVLRKFMTTVSSQAA